MSVSVERLLEYAASHIQHMQKALIEINLRPHQVGCQFDGAVRSVSSGARSRGSGARVIRVATPALIQLRRRAHRQLPNRSICLRSNRHSPFTTLTTRRQRRHRAAQPNALAFRRARRCSRCSERTSPRSTALVLTSPSQLIAECKDDLASWPSAKHFTSWLGLAPSNKISEGKMLSSNAPLRRRAAALLRLAAVTPIGAFYRWLSARIGKAKAVIATARKVAVLFYNAVRHGMEYVGPGASSYELGRAPQTCAISCSSRTFPPARRRCS